MPTLEEINALTTKWGDKIAGKEIAAAMAKFPLSANDPRTMPSRTFLIGQSVLNAIHAERGYGGPSYLDASYLRGRSRAGREIPDAFAAAIRVHFRALVAQYGGTTCP